MQKCYYFRVFFGVYFFVSIFDNSEGFVVLLFVIMGGYNFFANKSVTFLLVNFDTGLLITVDGLATYCAYFY